MTICRACGGSTDKQEDACPWCEEQWTGEPDVRHDSGDAVVSTDYADCELCSVAVETVRLLSRLRYGQEPTLSQVEAEAKDAALRLLARVFDGYKPHGVD